MTGPRIGSLCTGYGGLDMAVQQVYGGRTVWVSDVDKGANKILAHRYTGVPNLGDFTKTDWADAEPVDILTAGFPCQPVSHAGKRLGSDDERWLWDDVARAVGELRPGLVVLENVRGLLTAGSGRLFGRVLGALADLGYDARWHGLRAADVGAPHGRWRVFIVAHSASNTRRVAHRAETGPNRGDQPRRAGSLLPTPRATDGTKGGPGQRGSSGDLMLPSAVALLPTPTSSDSKASGSAGYGGNEFCTLTDATVRGKGSMPAPDDRLLATPRAFGSRTSRHAATTAYRRSAPSLEQQVEIAGGRTPREIVGAEVQDSWRATWGDYAAAIARWEHVLGRPAPEPTQTSSKGNPQLSPAFVEWMMGLPAGWVTDVPGITRNEALKALGNGVVPQQAAEALRVMHAWDEVAA